MRAYFLPPCWEVAGSAGGHFLPAARGGGAQRRWLFPPRRAGRWRAAPVVISSPPRGEVARSAGGEVRYPYAGYTVTSVAFTTTQTSAPAESPSSCTAARVTSATRGTGPTTRTRTRSP